MDIPFIRNESKLFVYFLHDCYFVKFFLTGSQAVWELAKGNPGITAALRTCWSPQLHYKCTKLLRSAVKTYEEILPPFTNAT